MTQILRTSFEFIDPSFHFIKSSSSNKNTQFQESAVAEEEEEDYGDFTSVYSCGFPIASSSRGLFLSLAPRYKPRKLKEDQIHVGANSYYQYYKSGSNNNNQQQQQQNQNQQNSSNSKQQNQPVKDPYRSIASYSTQYLFQGNPNQSSLCVFVPEIPTCEYLVQLVPFIRRLTLDCANQQHSLVSLVPLKKLQLLEKLSLRNIDSVRLNQVVTHLPHLKELHLHKTLERDLNGFVVVEEEEEEEEEDDDEDDDENNNKDDDNDLSTTGSLVAARKQQEKEEKNRRKIMKENKKHLGLRKNLVRLELVSIHALRDFSHLSNFKFEKLLELRVVDCCRGLLTFAQLRHFGQLRVLEIVEPFPQSYHKPKVELVFLTGQIKSDLPFLLELNLSLGADKETKVGELRKSELSCISQHPSLEKVKLTNITAGKKGVAKLRNLSNNLRELSLNICPLTSSGKARNFPEISFINGSSCSLNGDDDPDENDGNDDDENDLYSGESPVFHHLTKLEFISPADNPIKFPCDLLVAKCPNLQILILGSSSGDRGEIQPKTDLQPLAALSSSLQVLHIHFHYVLEPLESLQGVLPALTNLRELCVSGGYHTSVSSDLSVLKPLRKLEVLMFPKSRLNSYSLSSSLSSSPSFASSSSPSVSSSSSAYSESLLRLVDLVEDGFLPLLFRVQHLRGNRQRESASVPLAQETIVPVLVQEVREWKKRLELDQLIEQGPQTPKNQSSSSVTAAAAAAAAVEEKVAKETTTAQNKKNKKKEAGEKRPQKEKKVSVTAAAESKKKTTRRKREN